VLTLAYEPLTAASLSPAPPRRCSVGSELLLYGKAYTLHSCNDFTRRWYAARDLAAGGDGSLMQPDDVTAPTDKYTSERTAAMMRDTGAAHDTYRGRKLSPVKRYMEASRGSSSAMLTRGVKDTAEQWRAHDPRAVLRFYGLIDETAAPGGHKVKFRVHLYLSDDCMELIQMRYPNGADPPLPPLCLPAPVALHGICVTVPLTTLCCTCACRRHGPL